MRRDSAAIPIHFAILTTSSVYSGFSLHGIVMPIFILLICVGADFSRSVLKWKEAFLK